MHCDVGSGSFCRLPDSMEVIAHGVRHKQADPATADSPEAWLEDFNVFSIYEVLPQILELWALNQVTTSKPKKK